MTPEELFIFNEAIMKPTVLLAESVCCTVPLKLSVEEIQPKFPLLEKLPNSSIDPPEIPLQLVHEVMTTSP